MNILILNGSPRPQGDTKKMISTFAAAANQHQVTVVDVCKKNIKGCLACEFCHTKGSGKCIQTDDMQDIYDLLQQAQMLILASPIYYHGISGQLKCVIDRFYAAAYPEGPKNLKKIAMFLSSGDDNMYDGAKFSYDGDFVGYLGLEGMGIYTNHDSNVMDRIRELAACL